jgi:hypothetical protein
MNDNDNELQPLRAQPPPSKRPEYLNLFEFEILESMMKDVEPDLKISERELLEKIGRIIEYIRARRIEKKAYQGDR